MKEGGRHPKVKKTARACPLSYRSDILIIIFLMDIFYVCKNIDGGELFWSYLSSFKHFSIIHTMPEGEIFLFDLTSFKHKQGVTLFQSRRLFYMGKVLRNKVSQDVIPPSCIADKLLLFAPYKFVLRTLHSR